MPCENISVNSYEISTFKVATFNFYTNTGALCSWYVRHQFDVVKLTCQFDSTAARLAFRSACRCPLDYDIVYVSLQTIINFNPSYIAKT